MKLVHNSMKNKSILSSVQNGLSILKIFTKAKPILGITDISKELNLPKSTVSRLINDLLKEGYLKKEKSKYRLGLSVLTLSGVIMSHLDLHREAFEPLKSLVNKINEAARISTLEGTQLIYLLKVESNNHPVRLLSHVGHFRPPTCSGPGKLLLAYQSKGVINSIIQEGLPKRGPNSITDPVILIKQLKEIRENGYSVAINEMHDNAVSIAAPIKDYQGKVIAAVSVAIPSERVPTEKIPYLVDTLVSTGKEISIRLGYMETFHNEKEV